MAEPGIPDPVGVTGPLADRLHPAVAGWFSSRFGAFTEAQAGSIAALLDGKSVLVSSPTGSGKTLAGFLSVIDRLVREHEAGTLTDGVRAIYVSPLRALTYDIRKNLEEPVRELGLEGVIRTATRTGDTPAKERAAFKRRPPHVFLTTPESLAITLCQDAYRRAFAACDTVIVDELHALLENKRGTHLAVSLERLEALLPDGVTLKRVGLSATVAPLATAARFLVGCAPGRACEIVEAGPGRDSVVEVLSPLGRDPYPPSGWTANRVVRDIARIVETSRTTLVFTNTRSGAENVSHRLKLALPGLAGAIGTHHSSLDRDVRLETEDRLKAGELRAVVCSTSLELGIDIGSVDTVVMVSTPKGISRTLQRIGRSGHSVHLASRGVLCATNINDLVECVVCALMTRERRLDPVELPGPAADVAAQHIVGMAAGDGIGTDEAFATLTRAAPFAGFSRAEFDRVVRYLAGGGRSLERQYSDTFGKVRESAGGVLTITSKRAERDYLMNVGTISAEGMVQVYQASPRRRLGEVEEGFVKAMREGDTFVLGGRVLRLVGTGVGEATVEPARGLPSIPSWNANKMPLATGLAREVTAFRTELDRLLAAGTRDAAITDWLVEEWDISLTNAAAVLRHFQTQAAISVVPTATRMVVEVYRGDVGQAAPSDPSAPAGGRRARRRAGRAGDGNPRDGSEDGEGGPHLRYFFHTLIGRRANDALSRIVAQRLRGPVGGNAMVTIDDYGFLLTLRPFQELDLAGCQALFEREGAEEALDEALAGSQLVKWQFRGVAQTGLMVPRNLPGRSRRLPQMRWSSEILFRVLTEHEPDHPLLEAARSEAKFTFLDTAAALGFLEELPSRSWHLTEVPVVSPFGFGLYASGIREGMMLEDQASAVERLYRQWAGRVSDQ